MPERELKLTDAEIDFILAHLIHGIEHTPIKKLYDKLGKAKKPRIKVSSAKAKGRDLQKWVCQKIANIFNIPFDNKDDQCLIHSREMGQSGTDVILRGNIYEQFPYDIECKAQESISLMSYIQQAMNNAVAGRYWLLVMKNKKLKKPIICMEWESFEKLFLKTL